MNVTRTLEHLEKAVECLKAQQRQVFEPIRESCTIEDAINRLRDLAPDKMISVRFDLSVHSDGEQVPAWQVYDGKVFHDGATLEAALNGAIAANTPAPAAPLEAITAALGDIAVPY